MKIFTHSVKGGKQHVWTTVLLPLIILVMSLGSFQSIGQTQLAAWSFPTTTAAPNTPTSFAAEFGTQSGTAMMYANGTNGSSSFSQINASNTELNMFGGSTVNDPKGTPSTTGALAIVNQSANGKSIVIKFSMTGYQNPIVTFAIQRTGTGFTDQAWDYSIDGVNFTNATTVNSIASSFALKTVDLSSFNSIDNAANVYLRITFTGATAAAGNNRIDNIQIKATAASFTPVVTASTFNGTVGESANFQISATGTPTAYAIASGALPNGLNLNTSTGAITGTPTEAGSFTISVNATNGSGTGASANIDVEIARGSQTISFGALANKMVGDADFNLTATASSGLAVTYSSSDEDVATISGNTVHIVGPGTTTITASQLGDANYLAADDVTQDLLVTSEALEDQTITFNALSPVTYGDASFALNATASSGLTVSYESSNTDVATVSGNTVTIVGVGTTSITASQEGNGSYNPAEPVSRDLTVNIKELTVSGALVDTKSYDGNTDANISNASLTGVVSGDDVSITGTAGSFADANAATGISVTANLTIGGADASKYYLTQPTGLTGDITKANQTITFNGPLDDQMIGAPDFNLTATASSGLDVTYTSTNPSVATVTAEGLVHVVAIGSTYFVASQSGNSNYNAATDVQLEQVVTPLAPVSIWENPIETSNPNTYNPYTIGDVVASGITVSGISRGPGINGTNASARYNANGWNVASLDPDKYFEWTITPDNGNAINFNGFEFSSQVSGSSNQVSGFAVRTSLDNFTSNIATPNATGSNVSLLGSQYQGITTAITFRVYGWGTTNSTGTYSINDFVFTGNVVTAPPQAPIVSVDVTDRSVCGGFDGAIVANVSGGTPPYTYSWTGLAGSGAGTPFTAGNVSSITGINYGFYNLTVTDAMDQVVAINNIHVKWAHLPVITHNGQASASCANTATLIIYAAAGVAPYTFSVDGVNYQESNSFSDLAPGPMTIYVKDASGCVGTKDYTILAAAPIVVSPYAYPASSCNADGVVKVYRTGGIPPYTYSIDGENYQSSNQFSGLEGNTEYTLYVKDSKGCVGSQTINVPQGAGLSVTARKSNTSACINDGTIQVNVSGGTYPYTYSLDDLNYQSGASFTDLPAGNYVVYVKDAKGCTGTTNITINTEYITLSALVTNASACEASDGSIKIIRLIGGQSPFTYSIDGDNYQASNLFTGLPAGYYTVFMKDSKTCVGQLIDVLVGPESCARVAVNSRKAVSGEVSVKAFPNPSNREFTLTLNGFDRNQKVAVIVTDVLGRRVAQYESVATPQLKIGSQLQTGTYHVQLIQGTTRKSITIVKD